MAVVFRCLPGTIASMANQLKMADIQCIMTLRSRGWSRRRIARELGVDRETVTRYVRYMDETFGVTWKCFRPLFTIRAHLN